MSGYRTTSGDPPRIGRPSKICAYQSMASVQNCSLCLSRRQGYRSQETVLISLCNESTRSINVARSGAPKYLAERLIGTVRRECLDRLLIFGESPPPQLKGRSLRHFDAQPAQAGSPYVCRLQQRRPRMILEYLGIADRH